MGAGSSSLQGDDPGEELLAFLNAEETDEEQLTSLLSFSIRPLKSLAEEKLFSASCLQIKENVQQERKQSLQIGLGLGQSGAMEENVCVLLEMLADFDISRNSSNQETWFLHNGLFFVKWLFSSYPEHVGYIMGNHPEIQKRFLTLLVTIVTTVEVTDESYHMVMEATDILTIASYSANHLEVLGLEKSLVESLLQNFIGQKAAPVFPYGLPSGVGHVLASGMWSVMTIGLGTLNETVDLHFKPLSEKSFNLLKELLETRVSCVTVLSNLLDGQVVKFYDLHTLLLANRIFSYLLKVLLAINTPYRRFVMTGTDLSLLLGSILKDIYVVNIEDGDGVDEKFNILQILSRDEMFNTAIHTSKFGQVTWYKERTLKNLTLEGLVLLVLLRAVTNSNNLQQLRNSYMAILLDMSGHFRFLDLYPAERIVSTLESLLKKLMKLSSVEESHGLLYLTKDIIILINNTIVNQAQYNPNLLHCLLYKQEKLKYLADQNQHLSNYFSNIFDMLDFISLAIDEESNEYDEAIETTALLKTITIAAEKYPESYFVDILEDDDSDDENARNSESEQMQTEPDSPQRESSSLVPSNTENIEDPVEEETTPTSNCDDLGDSNTEMEEAKIDLNINSIALNPDILVESKIVQSLNQETLSILQNDKESILNDKSELTEETTTDKKSLTTEDVGEESNKEVDEAIVDHHVDSIKDFIESVLDNIFTNLGLAEERIQSEKNELSYSIAENTINSILDEMFSAGDETTDSELRFPRLDNNIEENTIEPAVQEEVTQTGLSNDNILVDTTEVAANQILDNIKEINTFNEEKQEFDYMMHGSDQKLQVVQLDSLGHNGENTNENNEGQVDEGQEVENSSTSFNNIILNEKSNSDEDDCISNSDNTLIIPSETKLECLSVDKKEVETTDILNLTNSIPEKLEDIVNEEYRHFQPKPKLVNFSTNILQQEGPLIFLLSSEMLQKIDVNGKTRILIKDFDILDSESNADTPIIDEDGVSWQTDSAITNENLVSEDDYEKSTSANMVTKKEPESTVEDSSFNIPNTGLMLEGAEPIEEIEMREAHANDALNNDEMMNPLPEANANDCKLNQDITNKSTDIIGNSQMDNGIKLEEVNQIYDDKEWIQEHETQDIQEGDCPIRTTDTAYKSKTVVLKETNNEEQNDIQFHHEAKVNDGSCEISKPMVTHETDVIMLKETREADVNVQKEEQICNINQDHEMNEEIEKLTDCGESRRIVGDEINKVEKDEGYKNESKITNTPSEAPVIVKASSEPLLEEETVKLFTHENPNECSMVLIEQDQQQLNREEVSEQTNCLDDMNQEKTITGENNDELIGKHSENPLGKIDTNKNKVLAVDSEIYQEFAAQQRLIHLEETHQGGKSTAAIQVPKTIPPKKMSTNICLNGYNIRFDMFGQSTQPALTSGSVVCERAVTVVTNI